MDTETKWYLIDNRILGKRDNLGDFIFNNGHWENDTDHLIGDCLIGYDPYEVACYALGNTEIMARIKEIPKEQAIKFIRKKLNSLNLEPFLKNTLPK
ncbi:MAG: hypothetical protein J6R37_01855 [Clostridia bacterium]|nr:hypothetical protein [Clostridia bacterium]